MTFELLLHAAFVADKIWVSLLEVACIRCSLQLNRSAKQTVPLWGTSSAFEPLHLVNVIVTRCNLVILFIVLWPTPITALYVLILRAGETYAIRDHKYSKMGRSVTYKNGVSQDPATMTTCSSEAFSNIEKGTYQVPDRR